MAAASAAALMAGAASAQAAEPLKIGFLATLEGTYTVLGEDGLRGFKVALDELGNKAGGRDIEVIIGASDASPDSAPCARRASWSSRTSVDILIGPLSGSEGIAVKRLRQDRSRR